MQITITNPAEHAQSVIKVSHNFYEGFSVWLDGEERLRYGHEQALERALNQLVLIEIPNQEGTELDTDFRVEFKPSENEEDTFNTLGLPRQIVSKIAELSDAIEKFGVNSGMFISLLMDYKRRNRVIV